MHQALILLEKLVFFVTVVVDLQIDFEAVVGFWRSFDCTVFTFMDGSNKVEIIPESSFLTVKDISLVYES